MQEEKIHVMCTDIITTFYSTHTIVLYYNYTNTILILKLILLILMIIRILYIIGKLYVNQVSSDIEL